MTHGPVVPLRLWVCVLRGTIAIRNSQGRDFVVPSATAGGTENRANHFFRDFTLLNGSRTEQNGSETGRTQAGPRV